ncbi:MAG: rhodanese-like domain-containing protein [Kiritimatiellaceae bacterium]|nr:rhodanese-like domain-containing protein [Kiritimatiellaceae bacterium]
MQSGAVVIDVRTADEFAKEHIDGAIHIPYDQIVAKIGSVAVDKNQPIVVYCLSGGRSAAAKQALMQAGYVQVINGGGLADMKKQLKP